VLFVGGGGCGKSRVINLVLTPLCKTYYGSKGLMKEAQSNKAARGIGGITVHAANKLLGSSSLISVHLRPKAQQTAARKKCRRLGAKIFDECSQLHSKLWHADAYCTAHARSGMDLPSGAKVDSSLYAKEQTWGAVPVVFVGGDEMQLPPVPKEAGLFAPIEGTSDEQKSAVRISNTFQHVYRLSIAMRFEDDVLISILDKMRRIGGCKLESAEWDQIMDTDISGPDCQKLVDTEKWYEAAYEWSIVSMAQAFRSQLSAECAQATLFVVQAEDEYMNALDQQHKSLIHSVGVMRKITEQVLKHSNVNET
jgi:hypothetical protein